jgi:hypothetical protein
MAQCAVYSGGRRILMVEPEARPAGTEIIFATFVKSNIKYGTINNS